MAMRGVLHVKLRTLVEVKRKGVNTTTGITVQIPDLRLSTAEAKHGC